jgi:hypothetical protein
MSEKLLLTSNEMFEISQIVHKYFASIDDKTFSDNLFRELFAEEGQIVRPNGQPVIGSINIFNSQKESFARFSATQHIVSNILVSKNEKEYLVRANLQAMHIWNNEYQDKSSLDRSFFASSILRAKIQNENSQMKILELSVQPIWRSGSGYMNMLRIK